MSHAMQALRQLYDGHDKTVLFASAAILRLLLALAFPALPDLLTGRAEISTPVNSFKRCMDIQLIFTKIWNVTSSLFATVQEGLFLYEHGLDPYDGGIFHQVRSK